MRPTPDAQRNKNFPKCVPTGHGNFGDRVANDDEGVTAGADPDVGPVGGAATCELLSRTTVTVPELATATRPVSVSRLRRINSSRLCFAPVLRSARFLSISRL